MIEVLFVLAILAILLAVLVPNVLSSIQRANNIVAVNCARELRRGAITYRLNQGPGVAYPEAQQLLNLGTRCDPRVSVATLDHSLTTYRYTAQYQALRTYQVSADAPGISEVKESP